MVFSAESLVTEDARHVSRQVIENTWIVRDQSGKYRQYPIAVLSPFEPPKSRLKFLFQLLPWVLLTATSFLLLI